MSSIPRFAAYAAAFEKAFASDDWSVVAPFFSEQAVYEVGLPAPMGGRFEGRAAILAYFRQVLDGFDRRFASRHVTLLEGPREDGNSVWIRGRADYTSPLAPDLAFELEETATFEGDQIRRLEDRYDDATRAALANYLEAHSAALGLRDSISSRSGRSVEFFFDYGSPYSYLADALLPDLARRRAAEIVHRPMLLGAVFKATGNQSPMSEPIEAKRAYSGLSLRRCAAHHGVAFSGNPHFPINTLGLMRTAVAAQHSGVFDAFHAAIYPAFWVDGRDLGDPAVVADVLIAAGLDAASLAERAAGDAVKAELRATTERVVARGAFGAPSFFFDGAMYFGVDHLPFLERALQEST